MHDRSIYLHHSTMTAMYLKLKFDQEEGSSRLMNSKPFVYGRLPSSCELIQSPKRQALRAGSRHYCMQRFNVSHAFSCKKGGFVVQRHNELRDITGELLADVCHVVCIKPPLGELTGETLTSISESSAEARLDISTRGVWKRRQRIFFDVMVLTY